MASDGRLITTAEAARRLGLHLRKVQRMIAAGDIPVAQKAGGRYLLDASVVDFLARRAQAS